GLRSLEDSYCLINLRLCVLALRQEDLFLLLCAGQRSLCRCNARSRFFGICCSSLKALVRRPSILDEVSIACEVQRSAGVFGFDALEIGSRLINRIPLQNQTLVDRVERGGCRRDGRLVLRDGGPVVAIINEKEGLACLDGITSNNSDAGDDAAALGRKSNHLARGLNDSRPSNVIVVWACGCRYGRRGDYARSVF